MDAAHDGGHCYDETEYKAPDLPDEPAPDHNRLQLDAMGGLAFEAPYDPLCGARTYGFILLQHRRWWQWTGKVLMNDGRTLLLLGLLLLVGPMLFIVLSHTLRWLHAYRPHAP